MLFCSSGHKNALACILCCGAPPPPCAQAVLWYWECTGKTLQVVEVFWADFISFFAALLQISPIISSESANSCTLLA